jgi:hypothetical protein
MRRNLAIARAGEDSRHETWISEPSRRNFDLLVAYYGAVAGKWADRADFYDHSQGLKYPWIHSFLPVNPWIFEYDAVWLADDDIEAETATLADMFDIFHERELWIGQPSKTKDSFQSHPMFRCKPGILLRYTEFVEEQMPIFSKATLGRLWETFGETKSGWGLGLVWPKIVGFPPDRLGVIDATPVRHTRPHQTGEMYTRVLPQLGISARQELEMMRAKYKDDIHSDKIVGEVLLDRIDPRTRGRRARQQ